MVFILQMILRHKLALNYKQSKEQNSTRKNWERQIYSTGQLISMLQGHLQ